MIFGSTPALERPVRIPLRGSPRPARRPADSPSRPIVNPATAHPTSAPADSRRLDSAVALDGELVALSGVEARCRLIRARLISEIVRRKAWFPLGFVRLSDFARERLGVSVRSVQEDARVVRALESLPVLSAALESGELAWTRSRMLVRVASPENEATLLRKSATIAYRDLERWIREFASAGVEEERPASRCEDVAACAPSNTPHTSPEPDDPVLRWSIELSRGGRDLWRSACEYASRSAGCPVSSAQVLEMVAAEASAVAGNATVGAQDHEQRLRLQVREREGRGKRLLAGFLAEVGAAEGFAWLQPNSREPGPAAGLDALKKGLDEADAFELERRLQALRHLSQQADGRIAALLRVAVEHQLLPLIGFASVRLYVESRLGMSARSAWGLLAIERESWRRAPLLREAWETGRLTRLQAVALLPVVNSRNTPAWIERAGEVTLRRLQEEVAWVLQTDFDDAKLRGGGEDAARCVAIHAARMPPAREQDIRLGHVTLAEVQNRAHEASREAGADARVVTRLEICAPISVLSLVETTLDRLATPFEARWQTFERMIALALCEWMTAPKHRDPVFERDGWRCAVPACSSRCNLHDHHVKFQSEGGGDELENRITVCAGHHLHGIHAGLIHAEGRAPDAIRWKMPLATLVGDRYV